MIDNKMSKDIKSISYNEYLLDSDQLHNLDKLIKKRLTHISLGNQKYTDLLTGSQSLLDAAIAIIQG